MENNLHQAPAKPEVICSTLRAVPEETHPWFPDLEALFSDPRSRLIDSLVKNDLYVLLKKKGIEVQSTSVNGHGTHEGEHIWYDVMAVGKEEVIPVEVRVSLRTEDVTDFLKRLAKFKDWMRHCRGWRILGAVAYLEVEESAEVYAERQGLFVIRATGSSAGIINRTDFRPKVFS